LDLIIFPSSIHIHPSALILFQINVLFICETVSSFHVVCELNFSPRNYKLGVLFNSVLRNMASMKIRNMTFLFEIVIDYLSFLEIRVCNL